MAMAADIMTREVVTVQADTPVREVAEILEKNRFGSVPVLDDHGHVIGVVTEEDLVQRAVDLHLPRHVTFLGSIIYLENPAHFGETAEKILALTAAEIMDDTFAAAPPDTAVDFIASRLLDEDLRRILILDNTDHLLGIITRGDIVRMLTARGQLPRRSESAGKQEKSL